MDNTRSLPATLIGPVAAISALLLFGLSCRFSPQSQATAKPQGFLPLTAVANITPPPPPRQSCPVKDQQPAAPGWQDPMQAGRPLLDYLNAGGSPQAVSAPAGQVINLARPDLDGDGLVDLAFVVAQEAQSIMQPGTLFVFHCSGDRFELIYTAPGSQELSAPEMISSGDLNQDGRQDLLFSQRRCGAHTCSAQVQLLMMTGGELSDRFEGSSDDLPSPNIEVLEQAEGPDRIEITATGINSVGAGPFRPYSRIWAWDENQAVYRPVDERQAPPRFRIHVLHDADQTVEQGNLGQAELMYTRVIDDDSLDDWVEPARERAILSAYARFRLITLAVQSGQEETGQNQLELLQNQANAAEQEPYLELAQAFWTTYGQTNDYDQACRSARAFAASHSDEILDPLYFGYSNPTYSADDICPLQSDGDGS